jgi:hypothetical protein
VALQEIVHGEAGVYLREFIEGVLDHRGRLKR